MGGGATTLDPDPDLEIEPGAPVLNASRGGGNSLRHHRYCCVWPLPPAGPVGVVLDWLAAEIPEARAEVDGDTLQRAGR